MNVVSLIGNLASGVDVRLLAGERKVASFVVAVDRPGQAERADFVRVAVWNKQAELCEQRLGKGDRVALDGRLRSRTWEDAAGTRHSVLEVVANRIEPLDAS